jgi:AcrR family transcriptional regulator
MSSNEINTKEHILSVATDLFAKNGFEGTSVRDIANQAEVNLAAINYHFQNKENLYFEVFNSCYAAMENDISKIGADSSLDTKEFCWLVFEYFSNNGSHLLNTFRISFSEKLSTCENLPCISEDEMKMGPPGKEMLLEMITKDLGESIPAKGRHWAMRMIFADIFHFALMSNIPFMRTQKLKLFFFKPEEQKRSIYFMVEAMLDYLRKNPENWK